MNAGFERFSVDRHGQERICDGQGVRTGIFCGSRQLGDIGDIRRELYDDRPARPVLQQPHELPGQFRTLAKYHAAAFRIWAGDVQLVGGNALARVQLVDDFSIVVSIKAKHVDEDRASD
jgi:hypothetical protein